MAANIRLNNLRIFQNLIGRAGSKLLAVMQNENAIGQIADELHVVRDPNDGRRELVSRAQQIRATGTKLTKRIEWRWPGGFFVPADERLLHRRELI